MCYDSLPCSCCVSFPLGLVNVKEGWDLSTVYQRVVGASQREVIKPAVVWAPLVPLYLSLCMAKRNWTWVPCGCAPFPRCPPLRRLCKLCKCEGKQQWWGVQWWHLALTSFASEHEKPATACHAEHGLPAASTTPNAFLTGVSSPFLARHGKDIGLVGSPHRVLCS